MVYRSQIIYLILTDYQPGLAKGLGAAARRVGGPDLRTFYNFFFAGVKNFACGAIFRTFYGLPFHENFAIGPFITKKTRLRRRFTFIFCYYACPGGPKKQAARGPRRP
jgi:hypothetical protein